MIYLSNNFKKKFEFVISNEMFAMIKLLVNMAYFNYVWRFSFTRNRKKKRVERERERERNWNEGTMHFHMYVLSKL